MTAARKSVAKAHANEAARNIEDSILNAAGLVLDEHGYDGLSTTAVALRAGMSTGTLYRLYRDKHEILLALVKRLQSARADSISDIYSEVASAPDWRVPMAEIVRTAFGLRQSQPGARSVRRALQMSPELWQWEVEENDRLARKLALALRRRKPSLPKAKALEAATVIVTATVALLDLACIDDRRAEVLIDETIKLREAYLAPLLD